MKESDLEYIFTFGKYKNRTVLEVFNSEGVDMPYLKWCVSNVSHFSNTISTEFRKTITEYEEKSSSFMVGDMMSGTSSYFNSNELDPSIH